MTALTINAAQFDPRRPGVLGVQAQHFDGKGDLVGDALTPRLPGRPYLQVLRSVVSSLTIQVMNLLVVKQAPAKNLFHHMAVFLNALTPSCAAQVNGNRKPYVPVSLQLAGYAFDLRRAFAAKLGAAFRAAQFLLTVDRATRPALDWHGLAALDAVNLPLLVRKFAANAAALRRAIQRVFTPLFSIGAQFAGLASERLSAHSASELHRLGGQNALAVGMVAGARAVLGSARSTLGLELLPAARAGLGDSHNVSSIVARNYQYHLASVLAMEGVA